MPTHWLVALSLAVAAAVGAAIYALSPEKLSALGGILSGAGSILAVLWFSAGLRYQSKQLDEQRRQFASHTEQLLESNRRDALLVAQGILAASEKQAVEFHGEVTSALGLSARYVLMIPELQKMLDCSDAEIVSTLYTGWFKTEHAATIFMNGVKTAAELYCRSLGTTDIDYSKNPAEFYRAYSERFNTQAFFSAMALPASTISDFMLNCDGARKSALIAFQIACAQRIGPGMVKPDLLQRSMEAHQAEGYPLPAIAASVLTSHSSGSPTATAEFRR